MKRAAGEGAALVLLGNSFGPAGEGGVLAARLKRAAPELPLVQFPAMASQLDAGVDAVLLLSLVSGRNAQYLIEEHVRAVPFFERHPEVRGRSAPRTALVDGGHVTLVESVSQTRPLPADKPEVARGAPARGGAHRDARGVSRCGKRRVARDRRRRFARGARGVGGAAVGWRRNPRRGRRAFARAKRARISWWWGARSSRAARGCVRDAGAGGARMIDIHTHLLPGVDDGSPSVEVSVPVLERFRQDGVTVLVCTPHLRATDAARAPIERHRAILAELVKHAPPVPELVLGWEIMLDVPGADLRAPHLHLGDSSAALVEFPRMQRAAGRDAGASPDPDERASRR